MSIWKTWSELEISLKDKKKVYLFGRSEDWTSKALKKIPKNIDITIVDNNKTYHNQKYRNIEIFSPKILDKSAYMKGDWEGCLSLPDTMVKVKRAKNITLEYTSIREGKFVKIKRKFTDFDARVVQHELDHLNGFLITDRGKAYTA